MLDDLQNIIQFASRHLGFFIAVNFNVFIDSVQTRGKPRSLIGNQVINLESDTDDQNKKKNPSEMGE